MQVCISLQTDNHASTPPLKFFYRPDARPAAQPTASKHCRPQANHANIYSTNGGVIFILILSYSSFYSDHKITYTFAHTVDCLHITPTVACATMSA